jgi:eukaryotic-like serine/threonine-protein kinase
VHTRLEPVSVLAQGETIKLRSDCLQIGGDDFAVRSAEDVRGLGRTLTQAVTGRIPAGENDPLLQLLPEPMARAVRRALSGNARITEIAALAGVSLVPAAHVPEAKATPRMGPVAVPSPIGSNAPADPGAEPIVEPAMVLEKPQTSADMSLAPLPVPAAKEAAVPVPEPLRESTQPPLVLEPKPTVRVPTADDLDDDLPPGTHRRSAPLVIAITVLLAIATLWALYGLLHSSKAARPAAAPAAATMAPNPQPAATVAHPASATGSAGATVALNTPGWRVVAYTYMHEAQAQHKADLVRQRFPQLSPGVFALHGRAPYLVTLGGVMSREDALALRNKAVQMGMPRDTYAQNYH